MQIREIAAVAAVALIVGALPAGGAAASVPVGPGPVTAEKVASDPPMRLTVSPNHGGGRNRVVLAIGGATPVRHAKVALAFSMLTMAMGPMRFRMPETRAGVYAYEGPLPSMRGAWRLSFTIALTTGRRLSIVVDDTVA
jgi:hypothetical protein